MKWSCDPALLSGHCNLELKFESLLGRLIRKLNYPRLLLCHFIYLVITIWGNYHFESRDSALVTWGIECCSFHLYAKSLYNIIIITDNIFYSEFIGNELWPCTCTHMQKKQANILKTKPPLTHRLTHVPSAQVDISTTTALVESRPMVSSKVLPTRSFPPTNTNLPW